MSTPNDEPGAAARFPTNDAARSQRSDEPPDGDRDDERGKLNHGDAEATNDTEARYGEDESPA